MATWSIPFAMGDEVDAYPGLYPNNYHANDPERGRELASAAAYRIVKSGTKQILKGPSGSGMMASGYVVRHTWPTHYTVFLGFERPTIHIRQMNSRIVYTPLLSGVC